MTNRFISRKYHTLRVCTEQPRNCVDSKTEIVKLINTEISGVVVEAQLHKYGLVEVFWSSIVWCDGFSAFFIITSRGSGTGSLGNRSTVGNSSQQSHHRRSKSLNSTWGRGWLCHRIQNIFLTQQNPTYIGGCGW